MIRAIRGTIVSQKGASVVLMTEGGVGYSVQLPKAAALPFNTPVSLATHLVVRENCLELYGFLSENDLEFFELLLTIPKIGPKSAMQILDQASIPTIVEAVLQEDPGYLSKMTALGKKTAENVVAGLKGKLDNYAVTTTVILSPDYQDAFDALLSFGYEPQVIRTVLKDLPSTSASTLITEALKVLR